jgi:hypothetical protein
MKETLYFILLFCFGELIVNLTLFKWLRKTFSTSENPEPEKKIMGLSISVFKGILERFTLFLALFVNIPFVLTVFGAIKIGTRLEKNNKVQNDYFIIGNLLTILIAISYYFLIHYLLAISKSLN